VLRRDGKVSEGVRIRASSGADGSSPGDFATKFESQPRHGGRPVAAKASGGSTRTTRLAGGNRPRAARGRRAAECRFDVDGDGRLELYLGLERSSGTRGVRRRIALKQGERPFEDARCPLGCDGSRQPTVVARRPRRDRAPHSNVPFSPGSEINAFCTTAEGRRCDRRHLIHI